MQQCKQLSSEIQTALFLRKSGSRLKDTCTDNIQPCISINDVPEFNYVILYVYWLRSNMLHVVYISTDNKCHPAAVCISQGDNIVVKHWVCHALAYDVDSVSIKWKRGNLSLVY